MISYNTLVVLLGTSLLGANAGLVGSFAVLRRRSLTGDALAHASLPGLCLAFLLVGERSLPALLTGALVTGVLGVAIIAGLRSGTRIKEDAAIGIVLSVFFGIGIALSRMVQNQSTGGSKAGLDSYIFGKTAGMIAQDVYWIAGVSLVCLGIIVLLFKEFQLISFDVEFARVQGWPTYWLDLLTMVLLSVTVVIGLPAVGVVLMAALLILPAISARFWTDRLHRMLVLAGVFGFAIGIVGTLISARYSLLPTGPIIVLSGSILLLTSMLFAPRRGVIARAVAHHRFRRQWAERELLITLHELSAKPAAEPVLSLPALEAARSLPAPQLRRLLAALERDGKLERTAEGYRLTPEGRTAAAQAALGRRLWIRFLEQHPDWAASVADLGCDSPEEVLSDEMAAAFENGAGSIRAGASPGPWSPGGPP